MPSGFWANTQQRYRPGVYQRFNVWVPSNQTAAEYVAQVDSRLRQFWTPSRLAFWLKEGTYAGSNQKLDWKTFYVNENIAPTGDATDPNNAAYNWDLLDLLFALPIWDELGLQLQVGASFNEGRAPNWYVNAGYTWDNSNGTENVNWAIGTAVGDPARQAYKDFLTAFWARYGGENWWAFVLSECTFGNSSNWPGGGFTRDSQNQGYADVVNHIRSMSNGVITPRMGSNTGTQVFPFAIQPCGYQNPDPRLFQQGCSVYVDDASWPDCNTGGFAGFFQQNIDTIITGQATERNGMSQTTVPAGAWSGIPNPMGYGAGTAAHQPSHLEALFYYSKDGVIPVQTWEFYLQEHGSQEPANTEALVAAAFDQLLAGGSDSFPYFPASYTTGAPDPGGSGTYTFVAAGAQDSTGSPGQPAGKSVGDLLLCYAAARLNSETLNAPPSNGGLSWTLLANEGSLALYGKFAEDTDTSSGSKDAIVSHDFHSGTSLSRSQIACFSGDVWDGLITEIVHASFGTTFGSGTADIPNIAATATIDQQLAIGMGKKAKTTTSNGATLTSPSGLSNRIGDSWLNGTNLGYVWDYTQQTTASAIGASVWDQSVEENNYGASLIVFLKTASASASIPDVPSTVAGTQQGATSILVTHDDESGAVGYRYYLTEANGVDISPRQFIAERTQAQKTADGGYEITVLNGGTLYKGVVTSFNTAGESAASAEWSETTDTPADTTPPTFAGITSASYNASTNEVTLSFSKGSDAVTAEANLRYYAHVAVDPSTPDFDVDDYGPFTDVTEIIIDDLANETYNVGVSVKDQAGNRSTNTDTEQVVVGVEIVSGTILPLENLSGTTNIGDAYLFIAPQGVGMNNVNISSPATDSSAIPITFESDGSVILTGIVGIAGTYDWIMVNEDGTLRGSGTAVLS